MLIALIICYAAAGGFLTLAMSERLARMGRNLPLVPRLVLLTLWPVVAPVGFAVLLVAYSLRDRAASPAKRTATP